MSLQTHSVAPIAERKGIVSQNASRSRTRVQKGVSTEKEEVPKERAKEKAKARKEFTNSLVTIPSRTSVGQG